jgi:phage protein D
MVLPTESEASSDPPPSVTQRHTDLRFVRELARRRGYEFYVRGADAHFHPPELDGTPQRLIAVNFGEQTNCDDLTIDVDGTRPTEALISRINPDTGEPETTTVTESGDAPMGTTPLSELRGAGFPQTRVMIRRQSPASSVDMQRRAQALLRRHGWWITAHGALDGLRYGRVLRSKKLVTIKGLGRDHASNYYVRKVEHSLTSRTYTMNFEAVRNSVGRLGTEPMEGETPNPLGVPAASRSGADTDVVVVAESGPLVAPA